MVTLISSEKLFLGCIDLRTGIIIEICVFNWMIVAAFVYEYYSMFKYGIESFLSVPAGNHALVGEERVATAISVIPSASLILFKSIYGMFALIRHRLNRRIFA